MKNLTDLEKDLLYYSLVAIQDNLFVDNDDEIDCKIREFILNFTELRTYNLKYVNKIINDLLNEIAKS